MSHPNGRLEPRRTARVNAIVSALRSARFARAVLVYLAFYSGLAAWLPWTRADRATAPPWAAPLGLVHPFSSPAFVAGVALLFASTLACTWGRRARTLRLLRGELPESALALPSAEGSDAAAFLRTQSFSAAKGPLLRRFGWALWGGWILHVGLLVLIAAVAIQQTFHDEGSFELGVGEAAVLSRPGAVFGRARGFLAPRDPPELEVALVSYDPFLHQRGYAPDRASRVRLRAAGGEASEVQLDRSDGVRARAVTVYQAIPDGLALVVDVPGLGARAIHLHGAGRRAEADVLDPAGRPTRFLVEAEHTLGDPAGTGPLAIALESGGERVALAPGAPFRFGDRDARVVAVTRWAGFTYARSPGMPGIFAGFAIVLLGALLLAFPAGVARLGAPGEPVAARVFGRGADVLARRWGRRGANSPASG
jgi:hypothetical protein